MKPRYRIFKNALPLLLAVAFSLLACNLLTSVAKPSAAASTAAGAESPVVPPAAVPVGPTATAEHALSTLITRLLELRSVTITLQSSAPSGTAVQVEAQVDAAGNYHLRRTTQGDLPAGFPASKAQTPESTDLYVVSGSAYAPDASGGPAQLDYSTWSPSLEGALRGFYGPGMWLLILPKGSLTAAGSQSQGGFQTIEYHVSGEIETANLTGTIWIDHASGALVGADLQIPAQLLGIPGGPAAAPMKISLRVASAQVAPISPPGLTQTPAAGAPAASSSPGAGAGFTASQAGLPSGFPIYPGAHDLSGIPGQFVQFTVDTDVRTVSDFYEKQLKAGGWSGFSTGGAMPGGGEGEAPAPTAGPAPTATPLGWMSENLQIWSMGNRNITISYKQHPGGGTDLEITIGGE